MIGRTFSHYRILEKLGEGGMGAVYLAEDTALARRVAVKVMPSEARVDPEAKARFLQEARAASALHHPHIAGIFDWVEEGDETCLVMEYVEGETVAAVVRRGPLPVEQVVELGLQAAAALSKAHEKGIVHRDIKSGNLMRDAEGQLKVMDFGLAKLAGVPGLTRTGMTLGTVAYMSPEQARGEAADARSDLYSLGVVLYECLAGRLPFQGENEEAIYYQLLNEPPQPPTGLRTGIPLELEGIVLKCLEKAPADRYQDAEDLAVDLRKVQRILAVCGRAARPHLPPGAPRPPIQRWYLIGLGAAILVGAAIVTRLVILGGAEGIGPVGGGSPTAIAVLPFSVRGSDEFAYLGEGMVTLLSTILDGAGDLRSVDARAVLGAVEREAGSVSDLERGSAVASRFGAGLFVLGDILEVGGRLRLDASLYDASQGPTAVARATVEGEAAQLFELVDNLSAQLLAGLPGGPGARVMRIAAVTTESLAALKAYLQGESAFRAGHFEPAVEAFQRAVALDSLFALGYYRLSIASEWSTREELTRQAAEQAFRHGGRLSDHYRRLLEAFLAWRRGATAEAEELYRSLVGTYPDDVEAWFQLGEVLFHANPLRGRSFAESRKAFERVLSYEPDHATAILHLARIAAGHRRLAKLDSLVQEFLALNPGGDRELEMLALQAYSHGNQEEEERVVVRLEQASAPLAAIAIWGVGLFTDLQGAERLVRLLAGPSRPSEVRAFGHAQLAHILLAGGHWRSAKRELTTIESFDPASALEYRALLSSLPFLPMPRTELVAIRDALGQLDSATPRASGNPSVFFNAHDDVHPILQFYLLGLLSARLGDTAKAAQDATQLDRLKVPRSAGTLAADLAYSIRAQIDRQRGRTADALAGLEQTRMETSYSLTLGSPFYAQAFERFTRAELLYELGRDGEALEWYANLVGTSPFELVYLPISHLRRGQIYERLGEPVKAADHYTRFIELWKECDSELRPMVEEAEGRLARLREETASE